MNKELVEGEKISLKNLLGINCFVMVKINKTKNNEGEDVVYNNVDKVKANGGSGGSALKVKQIENFNPQPVFTPPQVPQGGFSNAGGMIEKPKEEDIFNDVF